MTLSTAAFDRIGLQIRPLEFERLVEEALAQVLPLRRVVAPADELTPDEVHILQEGGISLTPCAQGTSSPLARTAAEYAAILASALTVPEAARHLGVDGSRIRQRLAAQTLYGIKLSSGWRLPRFQFAERGMLPGFDRVAPRLAGVHPVAAYRWLTLLHSDLTLADDGPISPRAWLEMGLASDTVAHLAAELHASAEAP